MAGRTARCRRHRPGTETSESPVSLGHIGDIEFHESDRGAPDHLWQRRQRKGRRVVLRRHPAGSSSRHSVAPTDGRIAWVGPDEFWTVSDGRAGAGGASSSERPPLADDTLRHFAPGPWGTLEIVGSYGSLPFLGTSYQAMHAAAACHQPTAGFGGDPLPEPQIGAFMLQLERSLLAPQPYLPEGRAVEDMSSVRRAPATRACGSQRRPRGRQSSSTRLRCADQGGGDAKKPVRIGPGPKTTCSTPRASSRSRSTTCGSSTADGSLLGSGRSAGARSARRTSRPAGVTIDARSPARGGEFQDRIRPATERR